MKKLTILFFVFLIAYDSVHAQESFSIEPEFFDESFVEDLSGFGVLSLQANMQNTSDDSLSINWELMNVDAPTEWEFSVSDANLEYIPGVTTNQLPLVLSPQTTIAPFYVFVYYNETPGCASFDVLISLESDGSIIDTIEYAVSLNEDCETSTSIISEEYFISVFPNPFIDQLIVDSPLAIEKFFVFSDSGEILLEQKSKNVELAHLSSGMYFVGIEFENGKREFRKVVKLGH